MTRRAQTEMIGLVLIVVVIIIGVVLYLRVGIGASQTGTDLTHATLRVAGTTSFLDALSRTSVPGCNDVPFSRVARACIEQERFCNGDPCEILQETVDTVAAATLSREGIASNLSIEQTTVQHADGCNLTMDRAAATPVPIVLSSGQTAKMVLVICR